MPESMYYASMEQLGRTEGAIVVPDGGVQRLVASALDVLARAGGASVWQPPAVLSLNHLVESGHGLARLGGGEMPAEFCLSPEQELMLWQQVLAADDGASATVAEQAAPLAMAAWRLMHEWALPLPAASEPASLDVAAFTRWAAAFRARTHELGAIDAARLLAAAPPVRGPAVAHGFLRPSPAVRTCLDRLGAAPSGGRGDGGTRFSGHAFQSREQELHAAFEWAAAVADERTLTAVAIASLPVEAALARRCAEDVFGDEAVYLSAASSIARTPTLRLALLTVELAAVTRWDVLSEFIRHPLLAGAAAEAAARARFDAALRGLERHEVPLKLVQNLLADDEQCPQLAAVIAHIVRAHRELPARQPMIDWVRHFETCLAAAGWPGDGDLEAARAPQVDAWRTACDHLLALDAVLPPVSRGRALKQLFAELNRARPASPAPARGIYVVTPLEAALLGPARVWLCAAEGDALTPTGRVSPLLPLAAQRAAGVPGTDPGADLAAATALLDLLGRGEGRGQASYTRGDGELEFVPSPLLPMLAAAPLVSGTRFIAQAWRQPVPALARVDDTRGAPLAAGARPGGGVAALTAQAACPFRAFARHRLAADAPEDPAPGISARHKGIIVHRVLAELWSTLGSADALAALDADGRRELVTRAVARALTPLPFETPVERELQFVERERVQALIDAWLVNESARAPFTVLGCELPLEVEFGGLGFRMRMDRVDREADGRVVVIDYKTGACRRTDWQPPRMAAPQLPFYVLTAPLEHVGAVAFAELKAGSLGWHRVPGDKAAPEEWPALVDAWRTDLEGLVAELAAGEATPDPRDAQTCSRCEQALVCRLVERSKPGDENDDDDE
ncbi:MAG: PD-(D/E)XK nuclease family protein [Gammaproteobacteria bacterium]